MPNPKNTIKIKIMWKGGNNIFPIKKGAIKKIIIFPKNPTFITFQLFPRKKESISWTLHVLTSPEEANFVFDCIHKKVVVHYRRPNS